MTKIKVSIIGSVLKVNTPECTELYYGGYFLSAGRDSEIPKGITETSTQISTSTAVYTLTYPATQITFNCSSELDENGNESTDDALKDMLEALGMDTGSSTGVKSAITFIEKLNTECNNPTKKFTLVGNLKLQVSWFPSQEIRIWQDLDGVLSVYRNLLSNAFSNPGINVGSETTATSTKAPKPALSM